MAAFEVTIPEGKYINDDAVENTIQYICRHDNSDMIGGCGVYPLTTEQMIEQFYTVKNFYRKPFGKQVFHIIFSFERSLDFSNQQIMEMGYQIASYWGRNRQVVFAIHEDTEHKHLHMVINTVAFTNGNYEEYFPLDEIKTYAGRYVNQMIDKRWFGK